MFAMHLSLTYRIINLYNQNSVIRSLYMVYVLNDEARKGPDGIP